MTTCSTVLCTSCDTACEAFAQLPDACVALIKHEQELQATLQIVFAHYQDMRHQPGAFFNLRGLQTWPTRGPGGKEYLPTLAQPVKEAVAGKEHKHAIGHHFCSLQDRQAN